MSAKYSGQPKSWWEMKALREKKELTEYLMCLQEMRGDLGNLLRVCYWMSNNHQENLKQKYLELFILGKRKS